MDNFSQVHILLGALGLFLLIGILLVKRATKLSRQLEDNKNQLLKAEDTIGQYKERFSDVFDTEAECAKIKDALEADKKSIERQKDLVLIEQRDAEVKIEELRTDYRNKKLTYDALTKQIAVFRDDIELIELGFYEPKFDFDASEKFKEEIKKCKDRQKL